MNSCFIEILPGKYHIFPSRSCSQDTHMRSVRRGFRMNVQTLPQKDGSKFKLVYSAYLKPSEMAESLERRFPIFGKMCMERETTAQKLINFLSGNYHTEEFVYVIYHIHTFIGQLRVLPVIQWPSVYACFNASCLWPHLIPEDGWGLLVDSPEQIGELKPHKILEARLIDYQSDRRLCRECGHVYNIRRKHVQNWSV